MRLGKSLLLSLAGLCGVIGFGAPARAQTVSRDGAWISLPEMPPEVIAEEPWIRPNIYHAVALNRDVMVDVLHIAPLEDTPEAVAPATLLLPMPDGTFARFAIVESPVMAPELQAQFPDVRTYAGQGIDDPYATIRLDLTPAGFHAQVLSPNGAVYVDPFSRGDDIFYSSFYKSDLDNVHDFECHTEAPKLPDSLRYTNGSTRAVTRREFALANAATGEYTTFHGGTVAAGQAAIVTAINRVTGVYENEFAVRLVLVGNNSSVVYTNSATDPYTNNDGGAMLSQNQTNLDSVIGSANYDVGHVFSTGGGGIAQLGVVCSSGNKAKGVTGLPSPTGDAFYIDFVAHEMGHEFAANHTFNSSTGCGSGNRSSTHAYEPGSGSTIMAYAGVCSASVNLQSHSDAYMLFDSISAISTHAASRTCDTEVATANNAPTVNAGPNYTIPISTPLILTPTSASDPDGDALTYCWEERDLGAALETFTDNGTSPIWRSWTPSTSSSRIIPRLANLLANTTAKGEILPTTTRTINVRLTVRDNKSGAGATGSDDIVLTTTNTAGPFQVTSPNTAVTWSGQQTVTWNVANTSAAPVSCANVIIELSTNGGNTWTTVLAASTPNDGSEVITLPAISTSQARIRVMAVGNIFFDISNTNFTITPGVPANPTNVAANPSSICQGQQTSLSATVGSGEVVDWYNVSCGSGSVGTGNPLVVTPSGTTTYFARARRTSDNAVSSGCGSVMVTVTPNPTAPTNASSNFSTVCEDDPGNITLTATGGSGTTLRWYSGSCGGTVVGVGSPLVIPSPTTTTTYYARWENSCGNSSCASTTVSVTQLPVAPAGASVDRDGFCADDAGNISLTATGGSGASLRWYTDLCGGTLVGSGSPLVIPSPGASTTYYARWENSCGSSACASVDVTVVDTPTAPTGAAVDRDTVCSTDGGTISLSASGGSGETLAWYSDSCGGTPVGTGSPLVVPAPTSSTTYYARWESACGNSPCASVSVTVVTGATPPTDAGVDRSGFCFDDDGSITLTANGGSGTELRWYSGSCGGTLEGTGSPLVIDSPSATTTYYAEWHSDCGDSGCVSVTVPVSKGPDFNGDGFVSGDDFDEFVAAFDAGDPSADYNGDGFVSGDDFDEFVADFDLGSC